MAQERARQQGGQLLLRMEDLDPGRCRPEFAQSMLEDLHWLGFRWNEGPDVGGPFAPYEQSRRTHLYRAALQELIASEAVYPCTCSRKDIQQAAAAPHAADDELIYPGTCRGNRPSNLGDRPVSWRFRVPDNEVVSFIDGHFGPQSFVAGRQFGDFVIWRPDDVPSYQLAVVVDDAAMQVSEVVRGEDLLLSAARQLLLYRALQLKAPRFHHCPLVLDERGERLAKRHDSLSIRGLRTAGRTPAEILSGGSMPG
jgi:glutamyl/glutaminyl-tRNA synthetase